MRVLHVITALQTGGAEMMLAKLVTGAAGHCESIVLCLGSGGHLVDVIRAAGAKVVILNARSTRFSLRELMKALKLLRQWRPDIIQGWMYHGNLAALLIKLFVCQSAILLWNIRCSLLDLRDFSLTTRAIIWINRLCSRLPIMILFNSKTGAIQHAAFGFRWRRMKVIPNGFDLAKFAPDEAARQSIRASLGAADTDIVIGMIARFHPMKDFENFISAVGKVANGDKFLIVMAGRGVDATNKELSDMVQQIRLNSRIRFMGELTDVSKLLSALDIFCLSSSWGEAFPNVVGEAMAAAVPCVVTDVGDVADIVGSAGCVVPPRDSKAFAEAIQTLINMPVADRLSLGGIARQKIRERYSLQWVVEEYVGTYKELINAERR